MSQYKIDFTVRTNEDWCDTLALRVPNEDGTPSDVPFEITADWRIVQHLRNPLEALHTALTLSTDNERLILTIDEDDVLLRWNVPEDTMKKITAGEYEHDMVFIDPSGGIIAFAEGKVTVVLGATRL